MDAIPFEVPMGLETVLLDMHPHIRQRGEAAASLRHLSFGRYIEELVKDDLRKPRPSIYDRPKKVVTPRKDISHLSSGQAKAMGLVQRTRITAALRKEILARTEKEHTTLEISEATGVGMSTIFRIRAKAGVKSRRGAAPAGAVGHSGNASPAQLTLGVEGAQTGAPGA